MSDTLHDLADARPLHAPRRSPSRPAPAYPGITFGALLLELAGGVLALLGVWWIMAVPTPAKAPFPLILAYWPAAALLVAALLLSMVGQVARAIRDTARNSFR